MFLPPGGGGFHVSFGLLALVLKLTGESEYFSVEKVLAERKRGVSYEYQVLWEDDGSKSWIAEKDLKCPELLMEFKVSQHIIRQLSTDKSN